MVYFNRVHTHKTKEAFAGAEGAIQTYHSLPDQLDTCIHPEGIFGTLACPDSGVRTLHWNSQWKVRTPESGLARVPEMSPGHVSGSPGYPLQIFIPVV